MKRAPSLPSFTMHTRGLGALAQPFGPELSYKEGVNSSPMAQDAVLAQGFRERLSSVALVEGPHALLFRSTP